MEPKKKYKLIQTIILGTCTHILLLLAVFDTYFTSPLERGMPAVKSSNNPSSKRLVIFIVDGLRAQSIFGNNENVSNFLTSIRKTRGAWGVSHTRVPTESRPNHVAILGGIYEDPSAVFKSWRDYPVDFDTVFNESTNSWVIGSVEVVRLFNKEEKKHIKIIPLPTEMESFATKNQTILDKWVFDRMKNLLKNSNETHLNESGNIFSLHLCGLDMTGHVQKPNSKEYAANIRYLDNNLKDIEDLVNKKFPDNLTTFIFTADHGMTDWGSHGSGSDHETHTPFIAWGAGIKINRRARDIDQVDIAPMISALLGLNYPINSIGKLPVEYFDENEDKKKHMLRTNLEQVYKIMEIKQKHMKTKWYFYKPYLTPEEFHGNISATFNSTNWTFAQIIVRYNTLFEKILKGINYFNNYFMGPIFCFITCGLVFWIFYLFMTLISNSSDSPLEDKRILRTVFIISGFLLIFLGFSQTFPAIYYVYIIFPIISIYLFVSEWLSYSSRVYVEISSCLLLEILFFIVCIIVFLLSFYFRFFFSIMMLLISFTVFFQQHRECMKYAWIISCCILSIFPLLPVMFTKFNIVYFILGYVSWQYLNFYIFNGAKYKRKNNFEITLVQKIIFCIQNICLSLGFLMATIMSTFKPFEKPNQSTVETEDTLYIKQVFAWVIFLVPLTLIPFSMRVGGVRMLTVTMAFAPFYIMTTMAHEMIFLTFYSILLIIWIALENELKSEINESYENFRKSLTYLAFILIGYFGTGNIVSLSSFDPMWVRCFVTRFYPLEITFLIFLKHTIPIFYATCAFRDIIHGTSAKFTECFHMILLVSDIMVLFFLFGLTNVGSWEIVGGNLSRFIIADCLTIGIIIFYFVAYFLENVHLRWKFWKNFRIFEY